MSNSPDCAQCDYFLWGYLKSRWATRKIKTLIGLKKAISEEIRKVPQVMIDRALKSWPKRCRQVYYSRGGLIEKHR